MVTPAAGFYHMTPAPPPALENGRAVASGTTATVTLPGAPHRSQTCDDSVDIPYRLLPNAPKVGMDVIGTAAGLRRQALGQMPHRKVADQDDGAAVDEVRDRG